MKGLEELQAALAAAQSSAGGVVGTNISRTRAEIARRYDAEPYGDEVEDRSDYVGTDVRDTVESIKPELMDIFFGGDEVVNFAPRGEDDVEAAQQETEVCNYVIQQMNDGFMIFLGWFHDALAFKNGYVKRYWEETNAQETEEYEDLTPEERVIVLMQALEQGEVEIIEEEMDERGRWSLTFEITKREANVYRVVNVPPEEVVVSAEWTRLDFRGCPYHAHKRTVSVSDLIEMGFDRKQVEELPVHDSRLDNEEAQQRFAAERGIESDLEVVASPSMRPVLVYENYIRHDMDGDGVAELLQVYTAGERGEILKREGKPAVRRVDASPFNVLGSMPLPHKHYGLCPAEMVADIQKVRTVMTRQLIDNVVGSNNPDVVVDEIQMSENTTQDLSQSALGRNIRIPGGINSLAYLQPPQLAAQSLQALEYMASEREQRTGVTRFNQGIDADSLNKTFGGMKALMNAAQKKILLIARIFAETGVKSLFLDMHRDLRKGPLREIVMQLRGNFVPVNPRAWKTRADMIVNVGLGTGDRDIQFERLGAILAQQKEGMAAGLVQPKNIHHTLTKMLQLSGFRDVSAFFPEPPPGPMPQPEPPPDPAMMMVQVEGQKAQMKAQADAAKMQADAMKADKDREADYAMKREELASRERIAAAEIESRERIERMKLGHAAMSKAADLGDRAQDRESRAQAAREALDARADA